MTSGYLPVIIKTGHRFAYHRLAYYETLDKAHTTQQYQDYIAMVAAAQEEALTQYLNIVS